MGLESTPLAFRAGVLTITALGLHDVITLFVSCGFLQRTLAMPLKLFLYSFVSLFQHQVKSDILLLVQYVSHASVLQMINMTFTFHILVTV